MQTSANQNLTDTDPDIADLVARETHRQRDTLRLEEDLSLAHRYLEIEQLRLGDRLRLRWEVPEALPPLSIPTLSVQPLAENAIRHGIEPSTSGGEVSVRVETVDGHLQISVANTLPPATARVASGHQVGLSSVRARLHAATRGRGRVDTRISDGNYVAVIRLPLDAGD